MRPQSTTCRTQCLDFVSMRCLAPTAPAAVRQRSEATRERIMAAVRDAARGGHIPRVDGRAGRRPRRRRPGHALPALRLPARARRRDLRDLRRQPGSPASSGRPSSSPDADAALAETIANTIRFWSSEDAGPAPALRRRRDRPGRAGARRPPARRPPRRARAARTPPRTDAAACGTAPDERRAVALLLVLTSYETFRELREAGLSDRQVAATLQGAARDLLLR